MDNVNHRAYASFLNEQRDNAARYFLPVLLVLNAVVVGIIAVAKM